jgi:DNA polymerase-3 subunit alpha
VGNFVSLHNHTQIGSPLDGMNDVDQLFLQAKKIGHPAVAITDHGTMAAHFDAWKASKKTGVKLIPGVEAYISADFSERKLNHVVLVPQNEIGYRNLLRLNYESYKDQHSGFMGKKTPRISFEHLAQFNEGIICLTACSNGIISKAIMSDQEDLAIDYLKKYKQIFNDRFFLELQPHQLKTDDGKVDQVRVNETLLRFSRDYGVEYTITCDAHYLDRDHAKYHDLMLAIKEKKPVNDPDRFRYGVQDMYLKSDDEIVNFFGREIAERGMRNSIMIAESCEPPSYLEPKGPILPQFPVNQEADYDKFCEWREKSAPNIKEDFAYLRYKCIQGFKEKVKEKSKQTEYWNRVKYELSVIEERGFSSYMLIVADYVNWAKNNGCFSGLGRGSAAGSLVSYLIGVTGVDPLEYGLLFERFHNRQKKSFPDIDSDFGNPDAVKQYLIQKYGQDRVAGISNWSTLTPKVIIKDVARSCEIGGDRSNAFKIANHITSLIGDVETIEEAVSASRDLEMYMKQYPELYENAKHLQGLTRNWSVHAAGVVISDRPIYEIAPVRIDEASGMMVMQWEKVRCEEFGFVKMDLLGLNTLNVIKLAFDYIYERTGKQMSEADIPLFDKETYAMIGRGETAGVFQLESSLTPLCMRIKPMDISMIADINALGRPSCSPEQRNTYIEARFNPSVIELEHPKLENALLKTNGVSLFEEGMMAIAKDCAGWDLNEADALRKITKLKGKDPELVLKTEAKFIKDCMSFSGMKYEVAKAIWDQRIEPFGNYGFNKSHSVAYSYISYYTAWLRCHYPTEFMCAILNSEDPNGDKIQDYINECQKMGIVITPPDINKSGKVFKIIEEGKIATGLAAIKGVGEAVLDTLIENQPYRSMPDYYARCRSKGYSKGVIQALAAAGAFDSLGRTRRDIYENFDTQREIIQKALKKKYTILEKKIMDETGTEQADLSGQAEDYWISKKMLPLTDEEIDQVEFEAPLPEWEEKQFLMAELEVLGRTISGSIHSIFKGFFKKEDSIVTKLVDIPNIKVGSKVKIEAIIKSKKKEFVIKRGEKVGKKFCKYIIEDVFGTTGELTVWTEDYEKYKNILVDGTPFRALCRVSEYMEQKDISVSEFQNIAGKFIQ